jgi:hypothetical protein
MQVTAQEHQPPAAAPRATAKRVIGVEQLRRQIAHAAQITFNVLPDQVTVTVHNGVVRLDGRVGLRSLACELEGQAAATDGVIAVESRLEWDLDDVRTDERLRVTEVRA